MVLEIEKYGSPPFIMVKEGNERILKCPHISSDYPFNKPSKIFELENLPNTAILAATDIRGTTDGSPPYVNYIFFSHDLEEDKKIMTSYLVYTFNGPIKVGAWDDERKQMLENIDMHHVNITPDRRPDKIIPEHIRRINGKKLLKTFDLKESLEQTLSDMYNNLPAYYCLWDRE